MTLYRQLLMYTCVVLICLSLGLWMGELQRSRAFLGEQLQSHAQDTATSLGLSLSTLTDGQDLSAMEAMINALYDRGYYRLMQLRDLQGQVRIDRTATLRIEGVPAWFIRLLPLQTPQAEAMIMHGWQQSGTVVVESHPGYAYNSLWQAALTTTGYCLVAILVVALAGAWGLRRLLRPLTGIEEQALALTERRFHVQQQLPRTRELRRVVVAMNRLTERIRDMFLEQAAIADDLMQRVYQDPLTTLGNRRFLEAQIQAKVTGKVGPIRGAFLLVQMQGLQQLNQQQGYEAGDRLIRETGEMLRQACGALIEPSIARLGGGDFALLLPNIEHDEARRIGDTILHRHQQRQEAQAHRLCCGGVIFETPTSVQALLAGADRALTEARHRATGQAVIEVQPSSIAGPPPGRQESLGLLEDLLSRRSIVLYAQPTVSHGDLRDIVHHEILTRMIDAEGGHVSIAGLIPLAEQMGLMPALDRLILEQLLEVPIQSLQPQRVALNLSPLSLESTAFMDWFVPWLERCGTLGLALNFEFPEFQAIRHRGAMTNFAELIKRQGHRLGIDHFGQGLVHFGYLKSLLPDYVKIDRAITQELWNEQSDSTFFVNALCNVAHSLDIRVMVEGVETEEQWRAISRIHLDAVQGYLIQRPQPLLAGEGDYKISLTVS